jgi:hypothetical protein
VSTFQLDTGRPFSLRLRERRCPALLLAVVFKPL